MRKLWGARFKKKTHPLVEKLSSSIGYDYKLTKYDVLASIAHAKMLGKARIIPAKDSARIAQGLVEFRTVSRAKLETALF